MELTEHNWQTAALSPQLVLTQPGPGCLSQGSLTAGGWQGGQGHPSLPCLPLTATIPPRDPWERGGREWLTAGRKQTGLSHSPALKKPKPGQTAIQQDSWTLILPSFYFLPLLPLVWTANLPETLTQKRLLSSYPREKNNLMNKMWITSDSSAAVSPECSVILPAETQ